MCTVYRGNDLDRAPCELDCARWAVSGADAAAKADFFVNHGLFLSVFLCIYRDRQNGTDVCTFSASDTLLQRYFRYIVCCCNRLHRAEMPCRLQCFTAAATAVADKCRVFTDIFTDLYKVALIRALQYIFCFFL